MPVTAKDLTGQRFGNLTVLGKGDWKEGAGRRSRLWLCRCDCGNTVQKRTQALTRGKDKARSCGCQSGPSHRKLPPGEGGFNRLVGKYLYQHKVRNKRRAKQGKLPLAVALSREEWRTLFQQACYYCGSPPSKTTGYDESSTFVFNGVDRLDSSKGYHFDNCRSCCSRCNLLKGVLTHNEFIAWVRRSFAHLLLEQDGET